MSDSPRFRSPAVDDPGPRDGGPRPMSVGMTMLLVVAAWALMLGGALIGAAVYAIASGQVRL